ncbi:MAG TPA: hypothetical protein VED46_17780 [Alphaproteobacteria bacterium]|nr:hypothetical protein [Alphaproteobacteria bacterium]
MNGVGDWILGGATAVLGIIGLFVASHAHDEVGYYGGLLFFIFAVGLILFQVKRRYDRLEQESERH